MIELITGFLTDNAVILGSGAALLSVIEIIFAPFRSVARLWRKPDRVELINPPPADTSGKLTTAEFLRIRREMRADLLAELATADPAEALILRRRVDELERQIADPDPALAEARAEIDRLKAQLQREGNQIGADRLAAAEAALEKLDFSIADTIFAEIEERQKLEVQTAARAAYGRGEIAEAEIRWADAATHYARAARLDPTAGTLFKATHFAQLAGDYPAADQLSTEYLALAREAGAATLALALNSRATVLYRQGDFARAETLFREALGAISAASGESHPDYASGLSNIAAMVHVQGRYAEAESLYKQALEIAARTIGTVHPDYAGGINNLAGVVEEQGRYAEAEALFRQALEIGAATIGTNHPDYATRLNNLASVMRAQGRPAEAEVLYRQALAIDGATIGTAHPHYAIDLNNLAIVLHTQGRHADAEVLYRQALEIDAATIGTAHPAYSTASTTSPGWWRRRGVLPRPRSSTVRRWRLLALR